MSETYTKHEYDVVVIGAGGAGLRAAIEAARSGAKTAIITKSLLGKAHTVMAEGGCAAALQNADPRDSWKVHFHDTMKEASGLLTGAWLNSMQRKPLTEFENSNNGVQCLTERQNS